MEQLRRRGCPMINHLLQQTLRQLCTDSDWVYAVFWRILPRNYPPPKWDSESSFFDRSKGSKRNWILVWEDGYCDFVACANSNTSSEPNSSNSSQSSSSSGYFDNYYIGGDEMHCMQPELFFKMSHEVYNFGEGLIGKVAADNSHKWVYKEPSEGDALDYPSSWAQGALDPQPRTWETQFKSGIETIAIVAVKEGVIQLGSLKKALEDLNFVLFLQRKFNYLQSIPGVFALHPAVTQHVGLSKKAQNCIASSWLPSDNAEFIDPQQATMDSWTLDHGKKPKLQQNQLSLGKTRELDEGDGRDNMVHHCASKQLEDSMPCDDQLMTNSYSHFPCQRDNTPTPIMQSSLHALLSHLPSVTYRHL